MQNMEGKNILIEALDLQIMYEPKKKKCYHQYGLWSEPDYCLKKDELAEKCEDAMYAAPENDFDHLVPVYNPPMELENAANSTVAEIATKCVQMTSEEGCTGRPNQVYCISTLYGQSDYNYNSVSDVNIIKTFDDKLHLRGDGLPEFNESNKSDREILEDNLVQVVPQILTNFELQNVTVPESSNLNDLVINKPICSIRVDDSYSDKLDLKESKEFQASYSPALEVCQVNREAAQDSEFHVSYKAQNVHTEEQYFNQFAAEHITRSGINNVERQEIEEVKRKERNTTFNKTYEENQCVEPQIVSGEALLKNVENKLYDNFINIQTKTANTNSDDQQDSKESQKCAVDEPLIMISEEIDHSALQVVLDRQIDISFMCENGEIENYLGTENTNVLLHSKEVEENQAIHSSEIEFTATPNVISKDPLQEQNIYLMMPKNVNEQQENFSDCSGSALKNKNEIDVPDVMLQAQEYEVDNGSAWAMGICDEIFHEVAKAVCGTKIDISTESVNDLNYTSEDLTACVAHSTGHSIVIEDDVVRKLPSADLEVDLQSVSEDKGDKIDRFDQVKALYVSPDIMSDEEEMPQKDDQCMDDGKNITVSSGGSVSSVASSQDSDAPFYPIKKKIVKIFPRRKKVYSSSQRVPRPEYDENTKLRFVPYSQNDSRSAFQRALEVSFQGIDEENKKEEREIVKDSKIVFTQEVDGDGSKEEEENEDIDYDKLFVSFSAPWKQNCSSTQSCTSESVLQQAYLENNGEDMDKIIDAEIDAAMLEYGSPLHNVASVDEIHKIDKANDPWPDTNKTDVSIQTEISGFLCSLRCVCLENVLRKRSLEALCLEFPTAKKLKQDQIPVLQYQPKLIIENDLLQDCETANIPDVIQYGYGDCERENEDLNDNLLKEEAYVIDVEVDKSENETIEKNVNLAINDYEKFDCERENKDINDNLLKEEEYTIDVEVDKSENETIEKYVNFAINDFEKFSKENEPACIEPYNNMFDGKVNDDEDEIEEEVGEDQEVPTYPVPIAYDQVVSEGKLLVQPKCNFYWKTNHAKNGECMKNDYQPDKNESTPHPPARRLHLGLSRKAKPKYRLHPQI